MMAPGRPLPRSLHLLVTAGAALAGLWAVFQAHLAGQPLLALGLLVFGTLAVAVYGLRRSLAWTYLFPGVAGMVVFMAVPLAYTVQMGFTNYSSAHLLSQARARAYLLDQREVVADSLRPFALHADGRAWRLVLGPAEGSADSSTLVSAPLALDTPSAAVHGATTDGSATPPVPLQPGTAPAGPALGLRELLVLRPALQALRLALPDGTVLAYAGLREFGQVHALWTAGPDGSLVQHGSGALFRPNRDSGFFEGPGSGTAVERLTPGFQVGVGLAHYRRMLLDADFRGPFVSIFVWTVSFAGLTVLLATALGMALAVALNWEALRHRTLYRTLLFLPYAVPGFISILVFKGLFNQNFGEINAILHALFGIRPAWFADPLLAKAMLLIVNTWLGYPYVMILATGLIKAIPADLYEASAIAGAGPLTNFWRITAPLIARPLAPLLVASFAFNFNNFVLIALLTDGRPDHLNTKLPAGTTDILVSYTYRIAFTDAGQNFGLAAAISTLIFILVAVMAAVQLRLTRQAQAGQARPPR